MHQNEMESYSRLEAKSLTPVSVVIDLLDRMTTQKLLLKSPASQMENGKMLQLARVCKNSCRLHLGSTESFDQLIYLIFIYNN